MVHTTHGSPENVGNTGRDGTSITNTTSVTDSSQHFKRFLRPQFHLVVNTQNENNDPTEQTLQLNNVITELQNANAAIEGENSALQFSISKYARQIQEAEKRARTTEENLHLALNGREQSQNDTAREEESGTQIVVLQARIQNLETAAPPRIIGNCDCDGHESRSVRDDPNDTVHRGTASTSIDCQTPTDFSMLHPPLNIYGRSCFTSVLIAPSE